MRGRILKLGVTAVLLLAVVSFLAQAYPALVGADHAYIVQSGSMEPSIPTGSVVFVTETDAESISTGDVVTYQKRGNEVPITHRVVDIKRNDESMRLITKGDANENRDTEPVYRSEIVGTVAFSIPYIGYIIRFGQTTLGWFVLVFVPLVLWIFSELYAVYRAGFEAESTTGGDRVVNYCSDCGTDLTAYETVNFCTDCGIEL